MENSESILSADPEPIADDRIVDDASMKADEDKNVSAAEAEGKGLEGKFEKIAHDSLLAMLLSDPLLSDLPRNPSLQDVDTLIALEQGGAMKLRICKLDGTFFSVVVMNTATVRDLKGAVVKHVSDIEGSTLGHRHISWKHIWSNFCLSTEDGLKLLKSNVLLQEFELRNNDSVFFKPYMSSKDSIHGKKHARAKRRRFFHGLSKR